MAHSRTAEHARINERLQGAFHELVHALGQRDVFHIRRTGNKLCKYVEVVGRNVDHSVHPSTFAAFERYGWITRIESEWDRRHERGETWAVTESGERAAA